MRAADVLQLEQLDAAYGRTNVLHEIELCVPQGAVVALLGPNGAGKTTLLRAAAGHLRPSNGRVVLDGADVTSKPPFQRARNGLCLVPEGRGIFPNLSVRDNLRLQIPPWKRNGDGFEPALEAFPKLRERLGQRAGTMSGGEQQMLALSRPFLADPRVVLLDEVSMGLAPRIVDEIFEALVALTRTGTALLLVEQYVSRALEIADSVYLLGQGRLTFSGPAAALDEAALVERYIGAAGESGRRPSPST
jgi:branched-chain amino acid transport system ATP-binding protein